MSKTATSTYQTRISNNSCTRCGECKELGETRRKCVLCRANESKWRKDTRKKMNRDVQEQKYHMKTWAKRCLTHSRRSDKKYDRTCNDNTYITEQQLVNLRKFQDNKCFYCKIELQVFNRRRPDGLTVERLVGGSRPHNSDNVVLACHRCNCKRMGNKYAHKSPLKMYYDMWVAFKNHKRGLTL
jgi:hypothetical protein